MYNVGDKVRLTEDFIGGIKRGEVGVVTENGGARHTRSTLVRFESNATPTNGTDNGWYVRNASLRLIEDKPAFKASDEVRVVKARLPEKQKFVGKTAVITDRVGFIDDEYGCAYWLKFDDGTNSERYVFRDSELELVVDKPAFAVGDRVSVTCKGSCCVDRKGEVVTVDVRDDTFWVRFDDDGSKKPCSASVMRHVVAPTEATPVASSTSQEEGVVRSVGATVSGLSFTQSEGDVTVFDEDGDCAGVLTLAHFNEVHRILNEGAK
jgi:hypothetical protein